MKWSMRSKDRKIYDTVSYLGNWHPVFAWFPTKVNEEHGICQWVLWCKVMRKYKIGDCKKERFKLMEAKYMLPEDLTHAILESADEKDKSTLEIINFDCYSSKSTYREMVSEFEPDKLQYYPRY